jgi:single-strand DNA-binding protein
MTTTITTEANLTTDPILRFTKTTGQAVCTIRLACSARRKNAEGGYEDTLTVFYEGTAWGALAENLAESLRKGDRLLVHGSTYDEEWTDRDGMTRVKHVIQVTAARGQPAVRHRADHPQQQGESVRDRASGRRGRAGRGRLLIHDPGWGRALASAGAFPQPANTGNPK